MNLKHQKNFNSTYPIICSGMNTVSDVNLALAVKQAGCFPSFVAFNHSPELALSGQNENQFQMTNYMFDISVLEKDIEYYYSQGGDRNYILGISSSLLESKRFLDFIIKHKPAYLELYDTARITTYEFAETLHTLHNNDIKVLLKMLTAKTYKELLSNNPSLRQLDGVIIKGPKAAGRVAKEETDLVEEIKSLRATSNELIIIAQGGVHCADDIKLLQEAGADIVSIGTLFALSKESKMSTETKMKMLESSYADTVKIGSANQNGIKFSDITHTDENNTTGLRLGITLGKLGHVFAGGALDYVTEIKPVSQIVSELTSGL